MRKKKKEKPVIEDDERVRERVPKHKTTERILEERKRRQAALDLEKKEQEISR